MLIRENDLVLFQGDSITDWGRNKEDGNDLGTGYALMAAARFNAAYPERNVKFLNRGIGGNRSKDLKNRWEKDCLNLMPNVVSILIGINDCWRRYDNNEATSVASFESNYRYILKKTKEKLDARIILLEPFVLPYPVDRQKWREDLDPKIHVVRKLAREYNAVYIALDGKFAEAASRREPSYWAEDGVHPTAAGHALIAEAWLKAVEEA